MQPHATGDTRRVAILIFDGVQSLDVTGPLEVFAIAESRCRASAAGAAAPTRVEIIAPAAGVGDRAAPGCGSSPIAPTATCATGIDTLIVAGGDVRAVAARSRRCCAGWSARLARVRRLASVCTGAFLLAEAGSARRPARHHALGRRPSTWRSAIREVTRRARRDLRARRPRLHLGRRHRGHRPGAGAGRGRSRPRGRARGGAPAGGVPQATRRPVAVQQPPGRAGGGARAAARSAAVDRRQSRAPTSSVERLAARAAMSPRNFARVFRRETGVDAGEVRRARAPRRRAPPARGRRRSALEEVASRCGFGSAEQMRRTFHRHLRVRSDRLPQTLPPPAVAARRAGARRSGAGGSHERDHAARRLGALFFPGFELLDTFGPLEMFGNMPGAIDIVTVAQQRADRCAARQGPSVVAEYGFADCPPLDLLLDSRWHGHAHRGREPGA